MGLLLAILIFSGIILFHEFGHFLLAKLGGVKVVEFSLGMGPRILSFVRGETRYSLKAFPIGGSCMMLGEDEDSDQEGSFGSRPVWVRIAVVAAGPVFNFLLSWLIAVILIANVGFDLPEILSVTDGYPAQEAGLEAGDLITSIDGKAMHLYRDVSNYVTFHQSRMKSGEALTVRYLRDGKEQEARIVPKDDGNGRYVLGIAGSTQLRTKGSPLTTMRYGIYEVRYWIDTTLLSLKQLFTGYAGIDDLSGPVGVVSMIDDTYQESRTDGLYYVFLNMMNIAILLSANLGVMNLLPLPALDGGRLIFLLLELIRGKRIEPEKEGRVHLAGFLLLILLMIIVLFNDIRRIIF